MSERHLETVIRLSTELAAARERCDRLTKRVQELEGQARDKKLYAQRRIEEALGGPDDWWLDKACGLIRRRREMQLGELGMVIRRSTGICGLSDKAWTDAAEAVCMFLGVEFVK